MSMVQPPIVRSEDQLIQYVQETTNSAPEQQSKNLVLNHHILKVFDDPWVIGDRNDR